jgi:hypothetical protein
VPAGGPALLTVQNGGASAADPLPHLLPMHRGWQPYLHRLGSAAGTGPILTGRTPGDPAPPG